MSPSVGSGDRAYGVRSLAHAVAVVASIRDRGGTATVDIGHSGWPATVVVPGDLSLVERRTALEVVLAIDPDSRRLRPRRAPGASVRAETIRWAAGEGDSGGTRRCG